MEAFKTPRMESARSSRSVSTIMSRPPSILPDLPEVEPSEAEVEMDEQEDEGPPDFRYRHMSDIMASLGALWRRRLYTDLTLVVEGKPIRCHKVIMASASQYFHSRLFNGRRESPIDQIFVTNVSTSTITDVLDFIYTGECSLTLDNVEDILKAATLFQIPALQDRADLYLSENINVNNCLRLFKLSNQTNSPLTREQASWEIKRNFLSIWPSPIFRQLSCKELISLIQSDELIIPNEDSICNAIIAWLDADRDKRRMLLGEILRHTRLPQKRKEYIRQTLEQDKIVKEDVVCNRLIKRVKKSHQNSSNCSTPNGNGVRNSIDFQNSINNNNIFDDVVLLIGGVINEDTKFKCKQQVLGFDLELRRFFQLASVPMGCDSGVACCQYGSDIFVSGLGETRQNVARYIPSENFWRVETPMMIGRRGHAMVAYRHYLFVIGGMVDQAVDGTKRITTMIERYDMKKKQWNFAGNLPECVWGASAVIFKDKITTFGGYQSRETPTTSVQTYDIKSGLCRITSQLPFPVALTQVIEHDKIIYIVCPTGNIIRTHDCWRFQCWATIPDFKRAMFGALVHKGRLMLIGGKFGSDVYDDIKTMDFENQSMDELSERLPVPMYGFSTATITLNRGQLMQTPFLPV